MAGIGSMRVQLIPSGDVAARVPAVVAVIATNKFSCGDQLTQFQRQGHAGPLSVQLRPVDRATLPGQPREMDPFASLFGSQRPGSLWRLIAGGAQPTEGHLFTSGRLLALLLAQSQMLEQH